MRLNNWQRPRITLVEYVSLILCLYSIIIFIPYKVVDLSQILRDHELQVKSLLIFEEIQTASKKCKHSRYGSMRSSLQRFKRSPLKSMLLMHTHNSLPAKQLKYEPTPSINSRPQSLMLTGPGDAPVIKLVNKRIMSHGLLLGWRDGWMKVAVLLFMVIPLPLAGLHHHWWSKMP